MKYLTLILSFIFIGCSSYEPPPEPSGKKIPINSYEKINAFYTDVIEQEKNKANAAEIFPEIPHVQANEFNNTNKEFNK